MRLGQGGQGNEAFIWRVIRHLFLSGSGCKATVCLSSLLQEPVPNSWKTRRLLNPLEVRWGKASEQRRLQVRRDKLEAPGKLQSDR